MHKIYCLLCLVLCLMPPVRAGVEILHEFETPGYRPEAPLIRGPDGALYGTAASGGRHQAGTIFRIDADDRLKVLHEFKGDDGEQPVQALTVGADGMLYGTATTSVFRLTADGDFVLLHRFCGAVWLCSSRSTLTLGPDGAFYGTVDFYGSGDLIYRVGSDGAVQTLHTFGEGDGEGPIGNLTVGPDQALYGVTWRGGAHDKGALFKITPDGVYTLLHSFTGADGASPEGAPTVGPDGLLYGTTSMGGVEDRGVLYHITPEGAFSSLHDFLGTAYFSETDGEWHQANDGEGPNPVLTRGPDGGLYGTTQRGGAGQSGYVVGTVFRVTSDGEYTLLHSFATEVNGQPIARGYYPKAPLLVGPDGALYGTTSSASYIGFGTQHRFGGIFRITPEGEYADLHLMRASEGASLQTGLVLGPEGHLYGVAGGGGLKSPFQDDCGGLTGGSGAIFKISLTGAFKRVHDFDVLGRCGAELPTRSDLSRGADGALYGVTESGGDFGFGTVYRLRPDGTRTLLHSFNYTDGARPQAALTLGADGALYGSAFHGGADDAGTLYRIDSEGEFSVVYQFIHAQGAHPLAALTRATNGDLYGTTLEGGPSTDCGQDDLTEPHPRGCGAVFKLTHGEVQILHNFSWDDGAYPAAPLTVAQNGALYGKTTKGGNGYGVFFRIGKSDALEPLYSFAGMEDGMHRVGLIPGADGRLYGAYDDPTLFNPSSGGPYLPGRLYRFTTDGQYELVHQFADGTKITTLTPGTDGSLYGLAISQIPNTPSQVFSIDRAGQYHELHAFVAGPQGEGEPSLTPLVAGRDGALQGFTVPDGYGNQGRMFKIVDGGVYSSYDTLTETWLDGSRLALGSDGRLYGISLGEGEGKGHPSGALFRQVTDLEVEVTVANKTYDGKATAKIKACRIRGVEDTDTVACAIAGATAAFESAAVGVGKTVTVSGLRLTGADAARYRLPEQVTTTADIAQAKPSLRLSISSTRIAFGQNITLIARIGGFKPTGAVTFLDGSRLLASRILSQGRAIFSTRKLAVGAHALAVRYSGDDNHQGGDSSAVLVLVEKAEQKPLVLTATPDHLVSGGAGAKLTVTGGSGPGRLTWAVTPSGVSVCKITLAKVLNATGGAGACEVTVTKAGSANYLPATATLSVPVSAP